ncbi:hypothetical protein APS56_06230 [Pseudalgibacter alginicilyticus]|uniref:Uncharacterized protein n=1 Tax=Pseudalgibacter alginicilyticus TaxID=1736674 RepID=A0A0P0CFC9_9FLAO|nr:hypothetical protein [Pseudalgibacter alginicilyticus]ALJ04747.1 hypothetical protein APS56_06230 [Pseudalgibacter alginicilyticus]
MKAILKLSLLVFFFSVYGCSSESQAQIISPDTIIIEETPNNVSSDSAKAIYRQFAFSGTHNSYSGNLNGMNREGIKTQLENGFRFLEFDLFTYLTKNIINTTWQEDVDEFLVIDAPELKSLLTYSETTGVLKVYNVTAGASELIYDTIISNGNREFSVLNYQDNIYVFDYHLDSEKLTIYNFDANNLSSIHSESIDGATRLDPFIYNNNVYLAKHNLDQSAYEIQSISLTDNSATLNAVVYTINSVSLKENFTPFQQDNSLHIFKHNVDYVTSFTVETIDTSADLWSKASSFTSNSSLLSGTVTAINSNGKLFINAYAAGGSSVGSQLVIDQGKPNIVNEYINEIDLLPGAQANVFPFTNGYYLLLKKESHVQLSSIDIGVLTLGHDEPGDEVDLTVDNPSSLLLSDWVTYISNWSNSNPNHEPLFIMTELKNYEQWMVGAKWENIIKLMQENFGDKLRYHDSDGSQNESIIDQTKIVNGKTLYFMDENGSKEGGLLGKVVLYIEPNNNITKSDYTNDYFPFNTTDGRLQDNFVQLKRYRINNKLVTSDWRYPSNYGNDVGTYIESKDNSYISRIFHMESASGDSQYDNIHCANVMFALSDSPYNNGLYQAYIQEQKKKNELIILDGCN